MCVCVVVGKPNLVKDLCPRLLLDLCFVLRLGLGQAFQQDISPFCCREQLHSWRFYQQFVNLGFLLFEVHQFNHETLLPHSVMWEKPADWADVLWWLSQPPTSLRRFTKTKSCQIFKPVESNLWLTDIEGGIMIKNHRSLHKFAHWFFGPFGEENSRRLGV